MGEVESLIAENERAPLLPLEVVVPVEAVVVVPEGRHALPPHLVSLDAALGDELPDLGVPPPTLLLHTQGARHDMCLSSI